MRNLIKKILSESFINEKAAPRRPRYVEPKIEPEEDYNKTGWIHSMDIDDNGKINIIWKDDLHKIEKKYKRLELLDSAIADVVLRIRRGGGGSPREHSRLINLHSTYIEERDKLKNEIETESIDNPMTNFFN